jgi:capsular exopolysaccharide synthesis family protein
MKNPTNFTPPESTESSVNWYYLWMMGIRRKWLFFLGFIPVVAFAIVYLLTAPRIYESTAVVQVEQREQRAFKPLDKEGQPEDLKSEDVLKTIEQNLQNYSLFVNVASDPKVISNPDFLVGYRGQKNPLVISDLVEWLRSNTKVALRHGTRLIDVTVDHQVPAMAQELAQAIIDAFVLQNVQAQNATQQVTLKFLVAQSEEVKENLQKSEDSLQAYRDSLLLKDRIDDQRRVVDALRQRYREKHPQLIQARMLLSDLMRSFDQDFKNVVANSPSETAYWASDKHNVAYVSAGDRISTELKLVEARSEVLQKEVDTESALFDNILKQLRETNVNHDSAATDIRVVEPPPLPVKPAKPKKGIILFLGLAMGTVLGVGAVALAYALDSSIQTPPEAETLLGLPVLGTLPRLSPKKAPGMSIIPSSGRTGTDQTALSDNGLVVLADPGGMAAEGFRSLRAVINLLGKTAEHRAILFTSALPEEGKTFVSCNYALALAQAGTRTLLVDTDLRRPALHSRFNLENKAGFLEVVTHDLELTTVVHRNVTNNLDILSAGGRCPNPAEFLAGSGFKDVLTKALANYDSIILDGCPVNLVSDSLLIARYVDTVCLVIRAASTPRQAPLHAVTLLRRAQKEPAGIILNAVPPWHDHIYSGYKGNDGPIYRQNYYS